MSNVVINPYNFAVAGGLGAWKELARTTLGGSGASIDVTSIPNKMYYMVLFDQVSRSAYTQNDELRFNGDSASSYSRRLSANGGNSTSINRTNLEGYGNTTQNVFKVGYFDNLSAQEKLSHVQEISNNATGAGTAPTRINYAYKWANTSSVINQINWYLVSGETFGSGSELVVLGYDPTDTHTTADNFWQELASVELGSTNATFDSGTFTAKKYLWVQVYLNANAAVEQRMRFNSDSTSSYSFRYSSNGATDVTAINDSNGLVGNGGVSTPTFTNMFIVNNSATEKLAISDNLYQSTAGAGSDPDRFQAVNKWANTSSQITSIQLFNLSGGVYQAGSLIKVWGHD